MYTYKEKFNFNKNIIKFTNKNWKKLLIDFIIELNNIEGWV